LDADAPGFKTPPKWISQQLVAILKGVDLADPVEKITSFGRWWFDPASSQIVLSEVAAQLLLTPGNSFLRIDDVLMRLVSEDALMLASLIGQKSVSSEASSEVRVIDEKNGMRWLRLNSLPATPGHPSIRAGVVCDITAIKHATMRERLSFESTQCLIGTNTVADALTKIIRLVCESLGWEWGAYWALEPDDSGNETLGCKYFWHRPDHPIVSFTTESLSVRMSEGRGLIGRVWSSGQPSWVDDVATDTNFVRRQSAMECGLHSAYAFPVAYSSADGRRHSPGVLEFYSTVARQREALLPSISESIGALIAQTVQRIESDDSFRRLAQIDDLTGLANRKHFYQMLGAACANTVENEAFAVLYIDLDHFKPINDAYGHEVGNHVLQEFSRRIEALAPPGSRVGRLGGDEFAMLISAGEAMSNLQQIADQVLEAARTPFPYRDHTLTVSASVGISVFPDNGENAPELLRNADAAMYKSKQSGKNRAYFFSAAVKQPIVAQQTALLAQLLMKTELHGATARGELFLEYQPVFDLGTDRMVSVEALVRWRRQSGEILPPDAFIPIAEQSGLIAQIGRWVLMQACGDLSRLHAAGFVDLAMSVNMAAAEFIGPNLPHDLLSVVAAAGVAPSRLCLELTETMIMDYPEKVIPIMHALRERGFTISLDDFGIGYSSLSRLKQLPITTVKIDRSFVHGLPHDQGNSQIIQTILDLGRRMKFHVIAEGIETDAQLVFLRQFGCRLGQGFALAPPMSLATLKKIYNGLQTRANYAGA
jgi:diguanylate cyclase (GGDEF)-like protein